MGAKSGRRGKEDSADEYMDLNVFRKTKEVLIPGGGGGFISLGQIGKKLL